MAEVLRKRPAGQKKTKALRRVDDSNVKDFKLSVTITPPSDNLQDYSTLLFGEKKIGKTKLASLFPDSYFIKTEQGTRGVEHRGDICDSWKLYRRMLKLLRKDKSRTVIVDTVDLLFSQCDRFVCQKLGIDDVSEEDWGKGWRALRDEFTNGLNELMGLGKGVILISHATEKEIKTRSGEKYDRIQPTMAGQARDICEALVDIWGYFHYDGTDRILTIQGDEHISAGHRLDTRFRWDGKSVRNIDMTDSPKQGYDNLLACFDNKYKPRREDTDDEPEVEARPRKVKLVLKKKQA